MRSFVKIKPSRNGKITLSFIDIGKSCLNREFFTSLIILLMQLSKIKSCENFRNYSIIFCSSNHWGRHYRLIPDLVKETDSFLSQKCISLHFIVSIKSAILPVLRFMFAMTWAKISKFLTTGDMSQFNTVQYGSSRISKVIHGASTVVTRFITVHPGSSNRDEPAP